MSLAQSTRRTRGPKLYQRPFELPKAGLSCQRPAKRGLTRANAAAWASEMLRACLAQSTRCLSTRVAGPQQASSAGRAIPRDPRRFDALAEGRGAHGGVRTKIVSAPSPQRSSQAFHPRGGPWRGRTRSTGRPTTRRSSPTCSGVSMRSVSSPFPHPRRTVPTLGTRPDSHARGMAANPNPNPNQRLQSGRPTSTRRC
jgi:hypothetical protein